jgi:hypothetical protein
MDKKIRVGLDIDGCVRDPYTKLIEVYRREFNGAHWCNPVEEWDEYNIKKQFSIGDDIYKFWFHDHVEEIYTESLPYSDYYIISSLIARGCDVVILTDQPNKQTIEFTAQWINKYLGYSEIHFTPDKHLVPCDIYLDDAPHHIMKMVDSGKNIYVQNRPWNAHFGDAVRRVDSLTGFSEEVLLLDRGVK